MVTEVSSQLRLKKAYMPRFFKYKYLHVKIYSYLGHCEILCARRSHSWVENISPHTLTMITASDYMVKREYALLG